MQFQILLSCSGLASSATPLWNRQHLTTLAAGTKYYAVLNFNGAPSANPAWRAYSDKPNTGLAGAATLDGGVWLFTGGWVEQGALFSQPNASLDLVVQATNTVPEPSAFLLLGLIATGCIGARRLRWHV